MPLENPWLPHSRENPERQNGISEVSEISVDLRLIRVPNSDCNFLVHFFPPRELAAPEPPGS
jgi:hypothetical protein